MKPLRAADQGGTLDLPVNVRVLTRLLSAFDDGTVSARTLSELVLCDPILTLHMLVNAGPSIVGDPAQTLPLEACVNTLGVDMLHALVYRQLGRHMRGESMLRPHAALAPVWARSLLCAELTAGLARALHRPVAAARLAGLFHLSGQLVLLNAQPDAYLALLASPSLPGELLSGERQIFDTTHDAAGAALLEACGIPGFVPDAVRLQNEPAERLVDAPFEVRAVKLAGILAAQGSGPEATKIGADLLGIDATAIARLLHEALDAARANPAGIEIDDVPHGDAERPGAGGELSLQFPPTLEVPVSQSVLQTVSAFAESGANWTLRQALSGGGDPQGSLLRARRLTRLLTGLSPQAFFLATPDGKRLVATVLEGDPRELGELTVFLEGSPSLLARAALDRLPTLAAGSALAQGAALDRTLARMLGGGVGLLCLPMVHDSALAGVTVIALQSEQGEAVEQAPLLSRIAAITAENVLRAGRRASGEEQVRTELTERFRTAGKRIVHEAGNPLSIVKNYLKLLGDKLPDKAQVREELMVLNEELDRVSRIVQRMGDPLAVDIEEPARLDLNSMVNELMTLCRDTLFAKRGIEVVQQLDPQLPLLRADTGAVKQVALNILTNAAEAMPNGGRLNMMTADNVNLGGELFTLLQISDTGTGIGPEAMQRLFRAGTSTKGAGHEGIGLAVSASILQRLGGRILCRSSSGRGTIFLILLPRRVYAPDPDEAAARTPDGATVSTIEGTPPKGGTAQRPASGAPASKPDSAGAQAPGAAA